MYKRQELAEELGLTREEVVEALNVSAPPLSLTVSSEEGETQIDLPVQSPEENLSERMALRQILGELEPRDRQLIILRYFMDKTQTQTCLLYTSGPLSGHEVAGYNAAQGNGIVVGTAVAHNAYRTHIGQYGKVLVDLTIQASQMQFLTEDRVGITQQILSLIHIWNTPRRSRYACLACSRSSGLGAVLYLAYSSCRTKASSFCSNPCRISSSYSSS